jgi:hypothetical protein
MVAINIDFIQRCVSLLLYALINDIEDRLLPNDVILIRNNWEEKEGLEERCGGAQDQEMQPNQVGIPMQVELETNSDFRNSLH